MARDSDELLGRQIKVKKSTTTATTNTTVQKSTYNISNKDYHNNLSTRYDKVSSNTYNARKSSPNRDIYEQQSSNKRYSTNSRDEREREEMSYNNKRNKY